MREREEGGRGIKTKNRQRGGETLHDGAAQQKKESDRVTGEAAGRTG